jgi:hypothetical protein
MDFLLDALPQIAGEVFGSVAHLLNLELDIDWPVNRDTTSTHFELDVPDDLAELQAVTRDGVPVRCWTFPGDTADSCIIRTVKDDLAGWNLSRLVWVADRGFASAANRGYLTRGGGHYIHAERLRATNTEATAALARAGRYRTVAGNLAGQGSQRRPRRARRRATSTPNPASGRSGSSCVTTRSRPTATRPSERRWWRIWSR